MCQFTVIIFHYKTKTFQVILLFSVCLNNILISFRVWQDYVAVTYLYINEFINNKLHYKLYLSKYRRLRQHVLAILITIFRDCLQIKVKW
jgi:hypothetical protein